LRSIERDVDAGRPLTRHQISTLQVTERMLDPKVARKTDCIAMPTRIHEKHRCDLPECRVHPLRGIAETMTSLSQFIGTISTAANSMPYLQKRSSS
jgi:hypothetical protein